jgi:hypothetical protein
MEKVGAGSVSVPNDTSNCSPTTDPSSSGAPASTLTVAGTEVASGTLDGQAWSLWSAKGQSGALGIEDGGLVIDGRAYGLCPGYPNPAELQLLDVGTSGIVAGVVGYPGLAKVRLYQSTAGTFVIGKALPSPSVQVVQGVSFFIGALPASACNYPSLELNTTSPGVSAEHNLGFGACVANEVVPITESQGIWQLPPGQFPSNFGGGSGSGPGTSTAPSSNSDCSPTTDAATSGGSPAALEASAAEVASGTVDSHAWSLWSQKGESGATALENGGLVLDGREYGLCPGYPNPAELEMLDVSPDAIVYGVIGYPGLAKVDLYVGSVGSFTPGAALPTPAARVVNGVSFFIGALPKSACSYQALELNSTSPGVSAEHNLGFGGAGAGQGYYISDNPGNSGVCAAGKIDPISFSQGIWQLPPDQFQTGGG